MARLKFTDHWHNVYFAVNVIIWVALILLIAFLAPNLLRKGGIILGIASMVSVVSSAVLLRPRRRLAGIIVQFVAWLGLIVAVVLFFSPPPMAVAVLVSPAALLSTGILLVLSFIGMRRERELDRALRRG